ncbi:hypothetical protein AQUCO_00400426v1 [Aquilegia coerulea]|uniref:Uncharacterized protein n=1 Tax=Aquilegia coerulea TaxID=218851 RepID=A0A2G5EUX2_AQUCA|nr:hypothetical protein AQUCO_00400426v1 [Aquilegia coerulea]
MQQQQLLHPSWQYYDNTIDSSPLDMDVFMGDCEFSSSLTTTEDSSDVSSILYFPSNSMSRDDYLIPLPNFSDDVPFMFASEQYSPNSDDLGLISSDEVLSDAIENVFDWMQGMEGSEVSLPSQHTFSQEDYEGSLGSSMKLMDNSPEITSVQSSLVMPMEDMEVDNQLSIPSLLKAYGEAIEIEQVELAEVIMRRIKEKVSPMGSIIERIAYYFFQALDKQGDYLKQEASKNYGAAFRAFYQKLPNGRFAHFTANSAILEGIPHDVETLHIIDFDIGDGVQWPPLFEAIGCGRAVRLTSIKWKEDCDSNSDSPLWSFQETKRRLYNHSKSLGLKLKVEEMDVEELVSKMMNVKTINTKKEWLVFNCMVGLPQMGRQRSRRPVKEFLKVAKELISSKCSNTSRGIITLGEGDGVEDRMRNCSGFGSFLDEYLVHFHTMFQSMQGHFPSHLAEARIAMESLFVAPFISSLSCYEMWEEIKKGGNGLKSVSELESWRFSRENLLQAKEIVQEGNSMYSVRIEEGYENMMSLEYLGTSLVKVSAWR